MARRTARRFRVPVPARRLRLVERGSLHPAVGFVCFVCFCLLDLHRFLVPVIARPLSSLYHLRAPFSCPPDTHPLHRPRLRYGARGGGSTSRQRGAPVLASPSSTCPWTPPTTTRVLIRPPSPALLSRVSRRVLVLSPGDGQWVTPVEVTIARSNDVGLPQMGSRALTKCALYD